MNQTVKKIFDQHRPLCLASSSPRRKDMLQNFGLEFFSVSPDIDESRRDSETAESFVKRVALDKARKIFQDHESLPGKTLILSGDTIVVLEGHILGKPEDQLEAGKMIDRLSGKTHQVSTAFVVLDTSNGEELVQQVSTKVTFRNLDAGMIKWYQDLGEGLDKAGAYSIQGHGSMLVSRIEGSYPNVVGFPIEQVLETLLKKGWISLCTSG